MHLEATRIEVPKEDSRSALKDDRTVDLARLGEGGARHGVACFNLDSSFTRGESRARARVKHWSTLSYKG